MRSGCEVNEVDNKIIAMIDEDTQAMTGTMTGNEFKYEIVAMTNNKADGFKDEEVDSETKFTVTNAVETMAEYEVNDRAKDDAKFTDEVQFLAKTEVRTKHHGQFLRIFSLEMVCKRRDQQVNGLHFTCN